MREGDSVKVGPVEINGKDEFIDTIVSSIHRSRTPCCVVKAGQTATLALENVEKSHLRKVHMYCSRAMYSILQEKFAKAYKLFANSLGS